MSKLLLLDCDGTIREPLSGNKFIQHSQDQRIIHGADKAIAYSHKQGWIIVGITNQGGVAAGHKQLEDALAEAERILELLPHVTAIYLCPDFEGKHCWIVGRVQGSRPIHLAPWAEEFVGTFRKPQPGMLQAAIKNHGGDRVWWHKDNYWYVGDRPEDEQAAAAAHINFMWADVWRQPYLH